MNINIIKLSDHPDSELFLGNKIVKCNKEHANYVDLESTYEENVSENLDVVYDGGVLFSKCMKESFRKR